MNISWRENKKKWEYMKRDIKHIHQKITSLKCCFRSLTFSSLFLFLLSWIYGKRRYMILYGIKQKGYGIREYIAVLLSLFIVSTFSFFLVSFSFLFSNTTEWKEKKFPSAIKDEYIHARTIEHYHMTYSVKVEGKKKEWEDTKST